MNSREENQQDKNQKRGTLPQLYVTAASTAAGVRFNDNM
jgi:hypothetical protein